ncbi:MAG: helix-turn-helix transcriptional regulator [Gemmatimonadota bacterium]
MTAQVRQALEMLPLARFAEATGKPLPTLRAYRYGRRTPPPETAREIAEYLRSRSDEFVEVADALVQAATDEEEA